MGYKVKDLAFEAQRAKKISDALRGKPKSETHRQNISKGLKGIKRTISEEQRKKISASMMGKRIGPKNPMYGTHASEETRRKMSEAQKGKKHPMYGKHHSEESKQKMRKSHSPMSEETRKNLSETRRGEKSHNWKGGISFEPYCPKFTKEFKERVRAYFGHRCVECGKTQGQNGISLSIHHVTFDKKTCCNQSIPLFVPLCINCHTKSNHNRIFWQYWFTEMINHLYGGKCYFTKEEMIAHGNGTF